MRLDLEVLKQVTGAFLDSEEPTTDWNQLQAAAPELSEAHLAWYLDILDDDGYLTREDREPGIGVKRDDRGEIYPSVIPLRLTSQGMNFASQLHRPEAIKWINKSLKGVQYVSLQLVAGALQAWSTAGFPLP